MKRICWMAIGGLVISLCAAAQDNAALDQARNKEDQLAKAMQNSPIVARIIGPDGSVLTAPVTGAPYSADEVTTFTQTLADGTHIQREDKATVYRDSQGRLRRETPTEITITDPVAAVAYTLDPNKLTARKMTVIMNNRVIARRPVSPSGSEPAAAATMLAIAPLTPAQAAAKIAENVAASETLTITAPRSGPNTFIFLNGQKDSKTFATSQSLGTQSIEGVLSEGTSANETIPAGAIVNDRPIQVVNERWYSSELKTMTMTKHSDPRTGETVFRLTNVRRGEPSPDLFQLPAGYQVIAPEATQTISVPRR